MLIRYERNSHVTPLVRWHAIAAALLLAFLTADVARGQSTAIAPGVGLGGSAGMNRFGGTSNSVIASGVGWEAYLSLTTRRGWHVRGGFTLSSHDVAPEPERWRFVSFFVEPRYITFGLSPHFAPFLAGRVGHDSENLSGRSYDLRASGTSFGGGGGVLVRLAPQIALEAGVLIGRMHFDAYTFAGDFAWKMCLDELDAGTPLPHSISRCAGSRSTGGVVRFCYPPYYTEPTSDCSPPEIPYEGTDRSGSWGRAWIGVHFSLSSARH